MRKEFPAETQEEKSPSEKLFNLERALRKTVLPIRFSDQQGELGKCYFKESVRGRQRMSQK